MSDRLRVMLLHNRYQQRGGEDAVMQMELQMLDAAGHRPVVYLRDNADIRAYGTASKLMLAPKTVWAWDTYREVLALLRREKPDVAHFHNTFPAISPAAYDACREAGVPVVQTLHNYRLLCPAAILYRNGRICEECPERGLMRSIVHACYRDSRAATASTALMLTVHRMRGTWSKSVDVYIALTEFARSKFIAGGLPADRIAVKPNFIQTDPGSKDRQGDYALFVGRLTPEKGLRTLLSAWKQLPDIPLFVVGDGPLREELEAFAADHKLHSVSFRGRLTPEDTVTAIKGARFLVFPSQWYEGFPMTLIESFACGTPAVFSGLDSLREIVSNGSTGIEFRTSEPESLAERVAWAWDHKPEMEDMGRRARAEYESKYTAERNYRMLMEIYQRSAGTRSVN
jgi:glycosyltransferase involved in cell wall biosynthesis